MKKMQKAEKKQSNGCDVYHQRIRVDFEYPVHFTRNLFAEDNDLLESVMCRLHNDGPARAVVYVDSGLAQAQGELVGRIKDYFHRRSEKLELTCMPQIVPGGEQAKNGWKPVSEVMWTIGNLHLDRQSYVVAVGGGAMLDMIGFAASLVHRGLRLIRVPSTVLAQDDAGVGVKNAMDEHGMKNFVGTFAPPAAVLNDFELLNTLSDSHWVGGLAEAFKVAIIKDAEFFEFLSENAQALAGRDAALTAEAVHRCAVLHMDHTRTAGDPFELGSARPLDFGHWSAHKIESMSDYRIAHGQAVAIGIAIDSHYARLSGLITQDQLGRIISALVNCRLPIWDKCLETRNSDGELVVMDGLAQFREHLGGRLTITLPRGIGDKCEVHHMDASLIERAIEHLRVF